MPENSLSDLAFFKALAEEDKTRLELINNTFHPGVTHYHQMMTLAAAVAGVVIPVIYSRSGTPLVLPSYLRAAGAAMGITLVSGTLSIAVGRWLMTWMVSRISVNTARRNERLGRATDDREIGEVLTLATAEFAKSMAPFRWVIPIAALSDVIFYGSFVAGVALLMIGFAKS